MSDLFALTPSRPRRRNSMLSALAFALAAGACSSNSSQPAPDGAVDANTAPFPPAAHVPGDLVGGEALLTLAADAVLDTTALTLDGAVAPADAGWSLTAAPHAPEGPELAVLRVGSLDLAAGAYLRVVGERPLVVLASEDITIAGILDAAAHAAEPGPGGFASGSGAGAGGAGAHSVNLDGGGGGGGHREPGASGGPGCDPQISRETSCSAESSAAGGSAGARHGQAAVPILLGGSGGGDGGTGTINACAPGSGGAGGGAVQLYAGRRLEIAAGGGVNVGGGGGGGGRSVACAASGGGGGGAAGALYLQAPEIVHRGTVAANGGAGGAGGAGESDGPDGEDGVLGAEAAAGGTLDFLEVPVDNGSNAGGDGSTGVQLAEPGAEHPHESNGGGGGGAAGYIVFHCRVLSDEGVSSPPAYSSADCTRAP
ncbi:hypothetical protein [Haliangium ochraceum]|nr:hypothetical protein [Haliangium ochraceum]